MSSFFGCSPQTPSLVEVPRWDGHSRFNKCGVSVFFFLCVLGVRKSSLISLSFPHFHSLFLMKWHVALPHCSIKILEHIIFYFDLTEGKYFLQLKVTKRKVVLEHIFCNPRKEQKCYLQLLHVNYYPRLYLVREREKKRQQSYHSGIFNWLLQISVWLSCVKREAHQHISNLV